MKVFFSFQNRFFIKFVLVNILLSLFNEFLVYQLLSGSLLGQINDSLTVQSHLQRHLLTNIMMTIFASCLGFPALLLKKRSQRFLYFMSFGMINSFISQNIISSVFVVASVPLNLIFARLLFDFFYTLSIKFTLFEFFRRPIVEAQKTSSLFYYRLQQDFFTALFKNSLLYMLTFKGFL